MLKKWKNLAQLNRAIREQTEQTDKVKTVQRLMKQQILLAGGSFLLVLVLVVTMTAAWFTNVAKTSSMNFEAASWGVDAENISVGGEVVKIAPGTNGIVPLSVDNSDSKESLRVGVTVSKEQDMETELQKRIYFYVENPNVSAYGTNTETVSKMYLGTSEGNTYFYSILAGDTLEISEEYANDVPICWEWVQDVQGYYFKGTVANSSVLVQEYLRPIQYEMEDAVYETNMEDADYTGALLSVGGQTKAQFLSNISATDGYAGIIEEANGVVVNNMYYYPVAVDNAGFGVWAYLCNYGELLSAMEYDNSLANSETAVAITATVSLTAESQSALTKTVTTEEELVAGLMDTTVDIISLGNDMQVTAPITLAGDVDTVLDMNGFALSYGGSELAEGMFTVNQGAKLTILNGQLAKSVGETASTTTSAFVMSDGADVTMGHVKITGFESAVKVLGRNTGFGNSLLKMNHCTLETTNNAVWLQESGSTAAGTVNVFANNCSIHSVENIGICVEQSDGTSTSVNDSRLIIKNSTITGGTAAVVQLQAGTVTKLIDSTLSGNSGLVVKGGSVTVADSVLEGKGVYSAPAAENHWTNSGNGILVEATNGCIATVVLDGANTIVKSTNGYGVELFGESGYGPGRVVIYNGTYSGAVGAANWNGIGTFEIYGGTFTAQNGEPVALNITRYDN